MPNFLTQNDLIREGSRGQSVRELQEFLRGQGFDIAADSIFGGQTARALRDFQKSAGIGIDAIVGPETRSAISRILQGPEASQTAGGAQPTTQPSGRPSLTSSSDEAKREDDEFQGQFAKFEQDIEGLRDLDFGDIFRDVQRESREGLRAQEADLRQEFASQEGQLQSQQANEAGAFQQQLLRIGGFLGPSASATGALQGLANEHQQETGALRAKLQNEITKARAARNDNDLATAKEIFAQAMETQKQIVSARDKFIDNMQARLKEERAAQQAKETSLIKEFNFATSNGFSGTFLDFVRARSAAQRKASGSGGASSAFISELGLPPHFAGMSERDITDSLEEDTPPAWFTEAYVAGFAGEDVKEARREFRGKDDDRTRRESKRIRRGKEEIPVGEFDPETGGIDAGDGSFFEGRRGFRSMTPEALQRAWDAFRSSDDVVVFRDFIANRAVEEFLEGDNDDDLDSPFL